MATQEVQVESIIRVGDTLTNAIDKKTKQNVTYTKVTKYYDGSDMSDAKVDNYIYRKVDGEYFLKNLGEYGQVLQKDTVAELRQLSDVEILLLKIKYYKHVQLNGYYVKGDTPAPVVYKISTTTLAEDGGAIFEVSGIKLEAKFSQLAFINYGVRGGNSAIDDAVGIKKLFTYASANKVNVVNPEGEYYLKQERGIPIKVNTDFGKSLFHVYEEYDNSLNGRFDVLPDANAVDVTLPANFINTLNSGETYIDFLKQYKNHYFIIENTNQFINRNGGSGGKQYFAETFFVGDNGTIISEITGKLNDYTSCKAYPVPSDFLTIKGGVFKLNCKTSTTAYKLSGFNCSRSRVTITNQVVTYEDGVNYTDNTSPDLGFHYFIRTYDSRLTNTQSVSRANEGSSGTYGLGVRYATKVLIENVDTGYGENAWGYMGGYIVKDLVVKNSSISRIDVHFSAHNVNIDNCFVNFIALSGSGLLKINDTTVRGNSYLPFRQDYGSIWDGDIVITNGKLINNTNLRARILNYQYEDFDFGQNQYLSLCKSLRIDGFTYLHKNATQVRLNIIDVNSNKMITVGNNRVKFPNFVELKNMRSLGNDGYCPLALEDITGSYVDAVGGIVDGALKTNSIFIVDTVDISTVYNTINHANGITQSGANELYPKFHFKNCSNVKINSASLLCEVLVEGSVVNSYRNVNTSSLQTFFNTLFTLNRVGTVQAAFTSLSLNTRFINCTWGIPKLNGEEVTTLTDLNTILGLNALQFGPSNSESVFRNHVNSRATSALITKLTSLSAPITSYMLTRMYLNKNEDSNPVLRPTGTTLQRPASATVGFQYYNTTTNSIDVWNGSSWQLSVGNATTTVKGLVGQSANVANSAATIPAVDTTSTAVDVPGVVLDLNDLIGKYNLLITAVTELQSKLNSKLENDRASGQQVNA